HENQITNVTAVQRRVEDFEPEQKFDGVISRAFASLNDMLTWCHHLPTEQGRFYALKGQYPTAELAQLPAGFVVEQIEKLQVPEADGERHLVLIRAAN
ncbi:16S rRNA (guanine(527)-N(7))-methyltransferase RsmG, partial [Pseudidiomarina aestuarii]